MHTLKQDGIDEKISEICTLYKEAPKLLEEGVKVVSCDEKCGIQALQRKVAPMKPGKVERVDYEYIRHGTQCLRQFIGGVKSRGISYPMYMQK